MDVDVFSTNVVGVMFKDKVVLNKLIYTGQVVLYYSKLEMNNLYYFIFFENDPLLDSHTWLEETLTSFS